MRVINYLTKRNIGLGTLTHMCEYLSFNRLTVNSKLSEEKILLFDAIINDETFRNWLKLKMALDKIIITDARKLISHLYHNSNLKIDELLGERILNALYLLLEKSFYANEKKSLTEILDSDKSVLDKIDLLKLATPFVKPVEKKLSPTKTRTYKRRDSFYDPYEDFQWGGLSGEEAYIGYWNTH